MLLPGLLQKLSGDSTGLPLQKAACNLPLGHASKLVSIPCKIPSGVCEGDEELTNDFQEFPTLQQIDRVIKQGLV